MPVKDLNLLYVFEAMWRDRSVTVAAENLGLTQAAVSSSLKRLREEYDDKLFSLVGRKMEPTSCASALAPQLLDALAIVRKSGGAQARFDPSTARRVFTVRTRDIGEVVCLPHLLKQLAESAPGVQMRTIFKPIEETLVGLAAGSIDLAMGFLPALEASIHRRPLFRQNYVCVMRTGHPLAKHRMTMPMFFEQEHLLVEYSGSGHKALQRALVDAGARHKIKVRIPQYLSAPHFVMASDMLWTAPAILATTLAKHYPLAIVKLPIELPDFEVALYWHDRFHRDPANKWLRDFMADALAPLKRELA
jgi:DNA-binding transcriptional LysR family regulator